LMSILQHLATLPTSTLIGGAKGDGKDRKAMRASYTPNIAYKDMCSVREDGVVPRTGGERGLNGNQNIDLLADDAAGRGSGSAGVGSLWDAQGGDVRSRDDVLIDLRAHIDTSPFSVVDSFSVARAFMIFHSIGLRHLVVTDVDNRPVGIVTRKDFLPHALDRSLSAAGARDAIDL